MTTTTATEDDGRRAEGAVLVQRDAAIATITLANPGRRNTITERMWLDLEPVCRELADDPQVRVVVVRGEGDDFSAGADISDLDSILKDEKSGHHDGGAVAKGEAALAQLHKPTIAAVEGYCLGGAWQIAAACDIRLASSTATFGITPAKIGIIYPVAGIERLVRTAGPATAKYLLFSGDFVDAEAALHLGLVQAVHSAEIFEVQLEAFATRMATRSQFSIQAMKDIVDTVTAGGGELQQASEHWQGLKAVAGDAETGIAAFLAKQTPDFNWNGDRETLRASRQAEVRQKRSIKKGALASDPIAQAHHNWIQQGWGDSADGMAAVTSLFRAHQILMARIDAVLRPLDLTFARFEMLTLLVFSRTGALPLAKASSRLQVHPTSVTNTVERLGRAGLVERGAHPTDGRAALVTITPEGHELALQAAHELNREVFSQVGMPVDDVDTLNGILAQLRFEAGDFTKASLLLPDAERTTGRYFPLSTSTTGE